MKIRYFDRSTSVAAILAVLVWAVVITYYLGWDKQNSFMKGVAVGCGFITLDIIAKYAMLWWKIRLGDQKYQKRIYLVMVFLGSLTFGTCVGLWLLPEFYCAVAVIFLSLYTQLLDSIRFSNKDDGTRSVFQEDFGDPKWKRARVVRFSDLKKPPEK